MKQPPLRIWRLRLSILGGTGSPSFNATGPSCPNSGGASYSARCSSDAGVGKSGSGGRW